MSSTVPAPVEICPSKRAAVVAAQCQIRTKHIVRTLEEGSRERYVPPVTLALVYAGLGEQAKAFEWLEEAYRAHDVHLAFLTVDPRWDAYDPRFFDLVARCGFTRGTTK